jgi:hypothetical protein
MRKYATTGWDRIFSRRRRGLELLEALAEVLGGGLAEVSSAAASRTILAASASSRPTRGASAVVVRRRFLGFRRRRRMGSTRGFRRQRRIGVSERWAEVAVEGYNANKPLRTEGLQG